MWKLSGEKDWLFGNLEKLMDLLHEEKVTVSDRKLRLFVVACCRSGSTHCAEWDTFKPALDQLELAADTDPYASSQLIDRTYLAWDAATLARWAGRQVPEACDILRDVVGNPWVVIEWCHDLGPFPVWSRKENHRLDRRLLTLRKSWLTVDVLSLAQAAYKERQKCGRCFGRGKGLEALGTPYDPPDYGPCPGCEGAGVVDGSDLDPARLAVLADALEEAGCQGELLAHLRLAGPHYRGCWALDLILGKE